MTRRPRRPEIRPASPRRAALPPSLLHGGLALLALFLAAPVAAGEVEIVAVEAVPQEGAEGAAAWRFDVTLRHADTGWEHYADRWEVRLLDGSVLGRRILLHPHVDEQPFTRSLAGVEIPAGVDRVVVHAHDKVHGWAAQGFELVLER